MSNDFRYDRCYMCRQKYPVEDLGRTDLPLGPARGKPRRMRVICPLCFQDLWHEFVASGEEVAIVIHGY